MVLKSSNLLGYTSPFALHCFCHFIVDSFINIGVSLGVGEANALIQWSLYLFID